jgi:cytidyltransferase-like protein
MQKRSTRTDRRGGGKFASLGFERRAIGSAHRPRLFAMRGFMLSEKPYFSALTPQGAENLAKWKYAVIDNSISTKLLTPLWNFCCRFVPKQVAPNVLTLGSLICSISAGVVASICENHYAEHGPSWVGALLAAATLFFTFSYQTLDAMDGKHARATGQSSPLGEYWDHGCDAWGGPLIGVAVIPFALGITGGVARWLCALTFVASFRAPHVEAIRTKVLSFSPYFDSGEAFLVTEAALLLRVARQNRPLLGDLIPKETVVAGTTTIDLEMAAALIYVLWKVGELVSVLARGVRKGASGADDPNYTASCRMMLACSVLDMLAVGYGIAYTLDRQQGAPYYLPEQLGVRSWSGRALLATAGPLVGVCVVSSLATCDIILAKMAGRAVLPSMPVLTAILLLVNFGVSWQWAVVCSVAYQIVVVRDVCDALRLPLLRRARTVYIDGVFDTMHEGHLVFIRKAASSGDKLVIGLCPDSVGKRYKRSPLMNEEERKRTLLCLPWVTRVIFTDQGWFEPIPLDHLRENHIDIVAHGAEYDPVMNPEYAKKVAAGEKPDYYKFVRESKGEFIDLPLPRTAGVSTTDIVARVGDKLASGSAVRIDGGGVDKKNV